METKKDAGSERELVIERFFDAPRERVWKEWTRPRMDGALVGTGGLCGACHPDRSAGRGKLVRGCMRAPDGKDYWSTGVYREIVAPERLVTTDSFANEQGNVVPASYYGMSADFPLELLVTITLEEQGGKTKLMP